MADPFAKLKQKERRDRKRSKETEMGVSGRGVKLLGQIVTKKSKDARERQKRRELKERSAYEEGDDD